MMAFPQIVDDGIRSGLRVFVRDQLGEFRRGIEDHSGILFERAKRLAPFGRLIDMPRHCDDTVGRFVILAELPLAGHADGTQLNRTPIRIEPPELLFGSKQTDFLETILDRFFGLQHGTAQGHGDLDGDRISALVSDLGRHDISSVKKFATGFYLDHGGSPW